LYIKAFKILQNSDKTTVIVRFIGTSALSSNISDIFESILFQLKSCFQLTIPEYDRKKISSIRKALETYLNNIYEENSKHKIIICLDSIDQLAQTDSNLNWLLTQIPYSVKIIYSTITNHVDLPKLQSKINNNNNFLEIESLNFESAKYIINCWLEKLTEKHKFTDDQWKVLSTIFDKARIYPLYIKIIFDIILKWTSYEKIDKSFLNLYTIDNSIKYIFENLEKLHGKIVFSRCMFYFTIFDDGISENELEDILSLDDDVLSHIFQHHEPSVRRFPGALWQRIKNDLKDYIFESKSDEIRVIHWYHRKFKELAHKIYIESLNENQKHLLLQNIIDYFNETWSKKPKPFQYTEKIRIKKGLKLANSEAFRKTKSQNLQLVLKNGETIYNKRKLIQLPLFLFQIANQELKINALKTFIYDDIEFLNALFSINSYLFNDRANEIWNLYNTSKLSMSNVAILNSIFEKNVKLFHKFTNTVLFQLSSLFASVKSSENDDINKQIEKFEMKLLNKNKFLICPMYSFMSVLNNDGLKPILFTNDTIKNLISSDTIPILIAFAENIVYLLDANSYNILKTVIIEESIESIYICSDSNDLTKNGEIIGHSKNEIYMFDIEGVLVYKRSLNNIKFLRLLSCYHACFVLEKSKFLEVMTNKNGNGVCKKKFITEIVHLEINVDQSKIVGKDIKLIYVIVCLENGNVEILQFNIEAEEISEISSIPSTGLKLLSCKIDRSFYINNQKENFRFACYFESYCCVFHVMRAIRKEQKADYIVNVIKFNDPYLATELTSSLVDFNENLILFLLNGWIYAYHVGKKI
jgi:hypothetical protein